MAFHYFASKKVDIAIIETGLGGRLDSTNILHPLLSVITNIDYDHMDMLGETLPEIAYEKAGIIKPKVPVVIGQYSPNSAPVFKQIANERHAPITFASRTKVGRIFLKKRIRSDVDGPFQDENKRTAWVSFITFKNQYPEWNLDEDRARGAFINLVDTTSFIGRWQWLQKNPGILADSAHNEHGLKVVAKKLKVMKYRHLHLVLGFVQGKDIRKLLKLFPFKATFYFSSPNVPRGMPIEMVEQIALELGLTYSIFKSIPKALATAKKNANYSDLIFVGGSSFVTAEVV